MWKQLLTFRLGGGWGVILTMEASVTGKRYSLLVWQKETSNVFVAMFTVISQQIVWASNWITIEQFPRSRARTTSSWKDLIQFVLDSHPLAFMESWWEMESIIAHPVTQSNYQSGLGMAPCTFMFFWEGQRFIVAIHWWIWPYPSIAMQVLKQVNKMRQYNTLKIGITACTLSPAPEQQLSKQRLATVTRHGRSLKLRIFLHAEAMCMRLY